MTKKDKKKIWTLGNFGDVWEGCGHTKLGQGSQRQAGGLRRLWEHRDLIWSLTSPQWGRTLEQWASGEKWGGGGRDRKYLGYSAEPQWLEPLVTPPPPPLTTPTHTNTPPPLTPTPCFSLCLLLTLTLLLLWWTFYALLNRMDSDTCFFFPLPPPPHSRCCYLFHFPFCLAHWLPNATPFLGQRGRTDPQCHGVGQSHPSHTHQKTI